MSNTEEFSIISISIEKPSGTEKSNWKPLTGSEFFKNIFKLLFVLLSIDWGWIVK